jgi:hypothetical protein
MRRLWLSPTSEKTRLKNEKICPKLSLGERLKATAAARTMGAKAGIHGHFARAHAFGRQHGESP